MTSGADISNVDLTALLTQNLDPNALAAITPDVKSAIQTGLGLVADAKPAYQLIDKLANGGTPNPQEAVAAMAGVATAVNPLAGAAVMAAGELALGVQAGMESLLKGLGLISDQIKPVQYVGLIKKGNPVPSGGPGSPHPDPLWMTWDQFARFWWPSNAGGTSMGWYPGVLHSVAGEGAAPQGPASGVITEQLMQILRYASPNVSSKPGNSAATGLVLAPQPANAFESFLFPILMKDVENWANANPYIDPRALLLAAIKTWNDRHQPSGADLTISPIESDGSGKPSPTDPHMLGKLLGSGGDSNGNGQRVGSQTVNMGARVGSPPPGATVVHVPAMPAAPAQTYHVPTAKEDPTLGLNIAAIRAKANAAAANVTAAKVVAPKAGAPSSNASGWALAAAIAAGIGYYLTRK